jgi:hypothetical protein
MRQDALPLVRQKFAVGTKIGIIKPFLKIAMDGTRMIRVDSPGDVVFLPVQEPQAAGESVALKTFAQKSMDLLKEGLKAPVRHLCNISCKISLQI